MQQLNGRSGGALPASGIMPVSFEEAVSAVQDDAAAFFNELNDVLAKIVQAFARQEPDLRDALTLVDQLAEQLRHAFDVRYHGRISYYSGLPTNPSSSATNAPSLASWTANVNEKLTYLDPARRPRPFLRGNFEKEYREYRRELEPLLGMRGALERDLLNSGLHSFLETGQQAAQSYLAGRIDELHARADRIRAAIPPVVSDVSGEASTAQQESNHVRLRVLIGQAELSPLSIGLRLGRPNESVSAEWLQRMYASNIVSIAVPVTLPLFLDLGRDGGLATDSVATVNNVILRLLALLPAGRLTAALFDPLHLGDSASALFGLGDSARAIIGDKVRTSERELSELLAELEDHITFVTQKYLQGTFDSLADYNRAAGEIAEPYRLLVLYNYPNGFLRPGGHLDDEAFGRLSKIVSAGPRCGVFTLIATTRGQMPNTGVLTRLWAGDMIEPLRLPRLIGGETRRWSHYDSETAGHPQGVRGRADAPCFIWHESAYFQFRPEPELPRSVVADILARVQRGLAYASDVRVTPGRVAELARARLAKGVALGIQAPETLPEPDNRATWWHGSTTEEVSAAFGRVGADDVGLLRFDSRTFSGALIGGRPGAGKSVLLHAVIGSLATRYAPTELELYLVDFKEGVEFKVYAAEGLPHARVVAIESDREFGLSVLEALDIEITRRGELFRGGSGEQVDIGTYRRKTSNPLPRILLVIDEFHVLFERDDKLATRAAELLDRIVRQGRAFGVHTILASQTLAGTVALGKHTLNQIPIRIALQCSETDSRLLLADDNPDARLLSHPGEGILNTANGLRDANQRFQAAFTTPEERSSLVAELRRLADNHAFTRRPVVFEAHLPVSVTDVPAVTFQEQRSPITLRLPLGLPLTLGGPVAAELRREPGGNLLIVTPEDQAYPCLSVILTTLAASGVEACVCDYGGLDAPWSPTLERLAGTGLPVTVVRRREAAETLRRVAETVTERHNLREYRARPHVLVLGGVHRAREFDAEASGDESELLERILRDGPEVGIHVICWCDRPVSLQRRLSSGAQRELGVRLVGQMSKDDSFQLIDSDLAAHLDLSQMVLDDHDRATTTRLRRFDMPTPTWVERIVRGGNHG